MLRHRHDVRDSRKYVSLNVGSIFKRPHHGVLALKATVPQLPLELLYKIIDYLYNDLKALSSCSVACRALLPHARSLIFFDINLPSHLTDGFKTPTSSASHKLITFAQLVSRSPSIGQHVKQLKLSAPFREPLRTTIPQQTLAI